MIYLEKKPKKNKAGVSMTTESIGQWQQRMLDIINIEDNIYTWRARIREIAGSRSYFSVHVQTESETGQVLENMGRIIIRQRTPDDECFTSASRETLRSYMQGRDTLVFRLEMDGEGAYCVSTKDFSDPYISIHEKAAENCLQVVSIKLMENYVRVVCMSDKTDPWDMIEEGLARRGLFLRDLRFDDFGRVNVVCGKRDK